MSIAIALAIAARSAKDGLAGKPKGRSIDEYLEKEVGLKVKLPEGVKVEPKQTGTGDFIVVYNGEIHREIWLRPSDRRSEADIAQEVKNALIEAGVKAVEVEGKIVQPFGPVSPPLKPRRDVTAQHHEGGGFAAGRKDVIPYAKPAGWAKNL